MEKARISCQSRVEGVNDAFKEAHISLPLPTATPVTDKNRRESGEQMVMKLNGDRMKQIFLSFIVVFGPNPSLIWV
jgi:hypothetical protein